VNLALLDTLKEKMHTCKDLAEVWEYFMDNFGENDYFMKLGTRGSSPVLEAILSEIANQLFSKPVALSNLMLVHLPERSFFHGGCVLGNKMGSLFYFDDIQVGLLTVLWSFTPSDTKLIRFSPRPVVRRAEPSAN
jgi:hypothetical protein